MNIKEELIKIKDYIFEQYNIITTIEKYLYDDLEAIIYKKGKHKFEIYINEPDEDTYEPTEYLISFDYFDDWHGRSYCRVFKINNYTDIDEFMKDQKFIKNKVKQESLF